MSQHDPVETLWNPRKSYFFLAALAFVFLQAGLLAGHWSTTETYLPTDPTTSSQLTLSSSTRLAGNVAEHPIPRLMADAERRYRALLSRQSRSLRGAVAEYKRRYGRSPPKGFDAWWRFVQENKVKIVDEYDGLVNDLEPFWEMTSAEFRLKAFQVRATCHYDWYQPSHAFFMMLGSPGPSFRRLGTNTRRRCGGRQHQVTHRQGRCEHARA